MKKRESKYSKVAAAIAIGSALVCSLAWARPGFAHAEKDKATSATADKPVMPNGEPQAVSEEVQLVQALEKDGLISQIRGFVVEKKQNTLLIDGKPVAANIAGKYVASLKKEEIRVQVNSFIERLKQHPDEGFMQVMLPVLMSSTCVDTKTKKEGC